jgi:hypothetical protein
LVCEDGICVPGGTGSDTDGTGDGGSTSGSATDGGTSGGTESGTGTGDTGATTSSTGVGTYALCDRIDFLFVVSNSGPMHEEQQRLADAFPGFMAAVLANVTTPDIHIMVLDTDAFPDPGDVETTCYALPGGYDCLCQDGSTDCCDQICADHEPTTTTCMGEPCTDPPPPGPPPSGCDVTLGAGRTRDWYQRDCGIDGGVRYLTETQTDLDGTFACVAATGRLGEYFIRPMDAMTEGLGSLAGSGQCNEGFLRQDSVFVVVTVSDKDDVTSSGTPASWAQFLTDSRGGNTEAVVALALIPDGDVGGTCTGDASQIRAFTAALPLGSAQAVCAGSYSPSLLGILADIETACASL